MKIVINTDQIYLHGGIEKVMASKVNYWADLPAVEVVIVTTEQANEIPCYPLDPRVKLMDLGINYNRSKSYFSRENLKKAITHYQKQKQLFNELQPDIIISPNFNFDHYWLPFIKQQAKLLKERHGSRYLQETQRITGSFLKKIRFKLEDWTDEQYDRIVVLNEDEKKYVPSDNAVVIPNPVTPTSLKSDISKKQVIAAGRISPVKGFGDLIEAWSIVHAKFPDWQLHFYGQDYLNTQAKLQRRINALNLEETVLFKGNVDDLPQTMADYSIYAMTSQTECFPMVLLEALSVGLPVVTYDAPNGPRNIVTPDQDSFLIPYQNIPIFAQQLKLLMGNQDLRHQMGQKAQENVQRFSLDKVMQQWNDLFNALL